MIDDEDLVQEFIDLDNLRESGEINMFGAADYIGVDDKRLARRILKAWMDTFGKGTPEQRVALARAGEMV